MPAKKLPQEYLSSQGKVVPKYTRGQMFVRKRKHQLLKKIQEGKVKNPAKVEKKSKTAPQKKTVTFKNKSGAEKKVTLTPKIGRISTVPTSKPVVNTRNTTKATKLRKSITPGTVLILLAGRFAGKRVVFLRQLESGLLLVTGPFKLNGVPLRRVNQRYVIATSTKVDVSGVNASSVKDVNFQKKKEQKKQEAPKTEGLFAKKETPKVPLSEDFKKLQQTVDEALLAAVKKVENLESYLKSSFTLSKGQYPHELKF